MTATVPSNASDINMVTRLPLPAMNKIKVLAWWLAWGQLVSFVILCHEVLNVETKIPNCNVIPLKLWTYVKNIPVLSEIC